MACLCPGGNEASGSVMLIVSLEAKENQETAEEASGFLSETRTDQQVVQFPECWMIIMMIFLLPKGIFRKAKPGKTVNTIPKHNLNKHPHHSMLKLEEKVQLLGVSENSHDQQGKWRFLELIHLLLSFSLLLRHAALQTGESFTTSAFLLVKFEVALRQSTPITW